MNPSSATDSVASLMLPERSSRKRMDVLRLGFFLLLCIGTNTKHKERMKLSMSSRESPIPTETKSCSRCAFGLRLPITGRGFAYRSSWYTSGQNTLDPLGWTIPAQYQRWEHNSARRKQHCQRKERKRSQRWRERGRRIANHDTAIKKRYNDPERIWHECSPSSSNGSTGIRWVGRQ